MRKSILLCGLLLMAISGMRVAAQYSEKPENTLPPLDYPPGIMFSTLLENVGVNTRGAFFNLGNQMQNVFMPDGATGKLILLRPNGTEFCRWYWVLDDTVQKLPAPYKLFGFPHPVSQDGSFIDYDKLLLTEEGAYTLDFYLGDKRFYTFGFSVRKVEPPNPFDGDTIYLTDGPWNDWGYLYYVNADPTQNLRWKIWMRRETHNKPSHKVRIEIIRDRDKKLICQSREHTSYRFRNDWARYSFDMINPPVKTSGGAYFKAQDLLAVDGGYTLTMKIDGAHYGTWKFRVEGGKPNYTGQTVRGTADPLTFVEGGKDAFWYKREMK